MEIGVLGQNGDPVIVILSSRTGPGSAVVLVLEVFVLGHQMAPKEKIKLNLETVSIIHVLVGCLCKLCCKIYFYKI